MKISDMHGRRDGNSGYSSVFNSVQLGALISKIQSTVISNGSELERIILSKTQNIEDLNSFIDEAEVSNIKDGTYVCKKTILAKSRYEITGRDGKKIQPDLLVFLVQRRKICKIIELKDGDVFDTKKVIGERDHLKEFSELFGCRIPFTTEWYICCFNQNDKKAIVEGLKHAFTEDQILTGREFCDVLGLSYDEIVGSRLKDCEDNLNYFCAELLKIDVVKEKLQDLLKQETKPV